MKKIIILFAVVVAAATARADFEIADLEWAKDVGARMKPSTSLPLNVAQFGAVSDSTTLNTDAIQTAIDVCYDAGGGIVTFPKGTFLTGSIYLKEGVHLNIPSGTTILGSQNIEDYPLIDTRVAGIEMKWPSALINVIGEKNVMISGKGKVFAQGKVFWDKYWAMRRDYEARGLRWIVDYDCQRPRTMLIQNSEDVTIQGLTLQQAGFWTIQLLYSNHCTVDGVVIQNNIDGHGPSTDGIDIDSSSKILVENCDIDCNDDNYCLKAGRDADGLRVNRPTEYIVIRNCVSRAGGGLFTCGSETSGGIRYVLVHGMTGKGTSTGFRLKSAMNRGGTTEHIYIKDVEMENIGTVFAATMDWNPSYSYSELPKEYEGKELPEHWVKMLEKVSPEQGTPHFNNIHMSNFKITGARTALSVAGSERSYMDNFYLDNMEIEASRGGSVSYSRNWQINNVKISSPVNVANSENVNF